MKSLFTFVLQSFNEFFFSKVNFQQLPWVVGVPLLELEVPVVVIIFWGGVAALGRLA